MSKKILILNGSHSEITLINAAKKLGFYVITTGNSPELIGHQYGDEYHNADFSDYEAVLKLAKRLNIDSICSCANDFGAITASYVAEKLCLGGHDSFNTTILLHHKDKFKHFAIENNIPTAYARSYSDQQIALDEMSYFSFPLIIKPVDLTGGKGVSKAFNNNEYYMAVEYAFKKSKSKKIVVENFINGTYHSFTSFILNEKVIFNFSDNEYSYLNPFLVSTSAGPAADILYIKDKLINAAETIAAKLKLVDGIFHIQYILKDRDIYIIEITRRCSGDLYPIPVDYATQVNWSEWIVKAESGYDCSNFPRNLEQKGFCGRHCIMASKNGIVDNVIINKKIHDNIFDKLIWWKKGDIIDNFMSQKLGIVFLKYETMDEMIAKTNMINDLIKVEIIE